MNDPGNNALQVSIGLVSALEAAGSREKIPGGSALFRLEDANDGVFLVVSGTVCMSVRGVPKLDRIFTRGSLLGLPSTFTRYPYALTAVALVDCEVIHVSQEEFLGLMRERLELCREATDLLCRESAFIENALVEQRRCCAAAG